MFRKIKDSLKEFDSMYSIAEKLYHLVVVLIILAFGSVSAFLSIITPALKSIGYFGAFIFFLLSALTIVLVLYFYNSSVLLREKGKYYSTLSNIKVETNPLAENFKDQVIHLEDLRLPMGEVQKDKTFRRCRLVGPLTIGILGGNYNGCQFIQSGSTLAIPNINRVIHLPGVLTFENCNFQDCVFLQVTIITTQQIGELFKANTPGADVIGLGSVNN
ncbi:hypothetical protein ABKV33_07695 [Enterobacter ludwigii]|uniref:hypothetical protein n=1 Tax=Enterobacter ludwigii TaxID=299767 RepID=UPI0032AF3AED